MRKFTLPLLLSCLLPLTACHLSPATQRSLITTAVADGVTVGVITHPEAKPALMAATPVVCGLANSSTNVSAATFIASVQNDPRSAPYSTNAYGVLILNNAFIIYGAFEDQLGTNSATMKQIMLGLCDGLNLGLGAAPSTITAKRRVLTPR